MMDQQELLAFVARAFLENRDGVRDNARTETAALAAEAGVEPYHIKQMIDEMKRRKWISGGLGGHYGSTSDAADQMRAFVNPLPQRQRTRAEIAPAVASVMLANIRAKQEFTFEDVGRESEVHVGHVRRLFTEWVRDGSGLRANGMGFIHWSSTTASFLDALVSDPVDWGTEIAAVELHHHGDAVSGDKHQVTIQDSTVGAVATGDRSSARGTVSTSPVSLDDVHAALKSAGHALVDAEDSLDASEHDEIHQLLRVLRSVQIEVSDLAENQRKAKAVLDDLYASDAAQGLRAGLSPAAKTVIQALLASPVFAELVKALVTGGAS